MFLYSYSKINLSLNVNSKLKNGLHEIQSYFCLINLSDKIRNKWPIQANKPIPAIIDHWVNVGFIQTKGIKKLTITAPTKPVIKSVNKGLSELLNFLQSSWE